MAKLKMMISTNNRESALAFPSADSSSEEEADPRTTGDGCEEDNKEQPTAGEDIVDGLLTPGEAEALLGPMSQKPYTAEAYVAQEAANHDVGEQLNSRDSATVLRNLLEDERTPTDDELELGRDIADRLAASADFGALLLQALTEEFAAECPAEDKRPSDNIVDQLVASRDADALLKALTEEFAAERQAEDEQQTGGDIVDRSGEDIADQLLTTLDGAALLQALLDDSRGEHVMAPCNFMPLPEMPLHLHETLSKLYANP